MPQLNTQPEETAQSDEGGLRATVIDELRRALEAFGGSATALAKEAGVSPSTITRPLKDPETASLPKWATIVKILGAAGLAPTTYGGPMTVKNNFHIIELVGEIRPGVWFEDADSRDYGPNVVVALDKPRPINAISAYVMGPDGAPYAPDTRVVVDTSTEPQAGDVVVFRRSRDGLIETSAAKYAPDGTRHAFNRWGAGGLIERIEVDGSIPFTTEQLGVPMGTVVATIWFRPSIYRNGA